jgi:hypothetical protein
MDSISRNKVMSGARSDTFCMLLLVLVVLASWIPRYRGPIDLRWDGGTYYVLGTSLAEGKGYRLLNEPGEILETQYPPGLPFLVAIHQWILGTDDPRKVGIWIRHGWCVLSVLYVLLTFLLARIFLPRSYALLVALACALNYEMYFLEGLCFAELPFAVTSTLFGYLYFKKSRGRLAPVMAGAAAVASYLIRTAGIALLIAWVADAGLRRQFRKAGMRAALACIPIIAWQSYVHFVETREDYRRPYYAYQRDPSMFYNVSYARNVSLTDPFRPEKGIATQQELVIRFVRNLIGMPDMLGQAVSAKRGFFDGHVKRLNQLLKPLTLPFWMPLLALVPLGLTVIAGSFWMLAKREYLVPIYVLLTVGAVSMTTWTGQFPRYFAPAEPYLLLALAICLLELRRITRARFPSSKIASIWPALVLSFIVVESAVSCVVGYRNFRNPAVYISDDGRLHQYVLFHYPGEAAGSEAGLKWLVENAKPGSILAVSMPQWVYLKTGYKTVMPPLEADPIKAQQLIDTVPANYVVLDKLLMEDNFNMRFPALVRSSPEKWERVFSTADHQFDIYERVGLNVTDNNNLGRSSRNKSLRF